MQQLWADQHPKIRRENCFKTPGPKKNLDFSASVSALQRLFFPVRLLHARVLSILQ